MEIPALADLLDLQDVDLAIDRLLDDRQNLPALSEYKEANANRTAFESALGELADRLRTTELSLDKAEGELEITEIKLSETETRLYSGGMNARETENMRLEVQHLGERRGAMEDEVLELLTARETLQGEVSAQTNVVAAAKETESQLEAAIASAWKEIDLRMGRHEARKVEVVGEIPPELLERYEKLRRTKEGVAVGRLEHGQCGGCHLTLSTTEQNVAKESDPPLCVHCRRILVL